MKLLTLIALAALTQTPAVKEKARPYTQLLESKPVQVGGFEFVALAEAQWVVFNPPNGRDPIQTQLRITNRTDKDLIFPTVDTFRIVIKTADGKEIKRGGGRDITLRGVRPVLIAPGASYCLCRDAQLRWYPDGKSRAFVYQDGTGSIFTYGPLPPGKYTLSYSCAYSEEQAAARSKAMSNLPVWSGKAVTNEVSFEVVDP